MPSVQEPKQQGLGQAGTTRGEETVQLILGAATSKAELGSVLRVAAAAGCGHVDIEMTFGAALSNSALGSLGGFIRRQGLSVGVIVGTERFTTHEEFEIPKGFRRLTVWCVDGWSELVAAQLGKLCATLTELRLIFPASSFRERDDEALLHNLQAYPNLEAHFVVDHVVDLSTSARHAMAHFERLDHPRVALVGFPVCLTEAPARLEDRKIWTGRHPREASLGAEFVKPPACSGCIHYLRCPGVRGDVMRQLGDHHLKPVYGEVLTHTTARFGVPIIRDASGVVETERVDIAAKYPDTVLMTLIVPGCDLNCVFCDGPQEDVGLMPSTERGVLASLRALGRRVTGVFFTGGEPTQLPWLLDAISFARAQGMTRVQMQSHAGKAADPAFADALVEAGLTAIDVPFYGPDAETHEAITATPGSFERTLEGLRQLQQRGVRSVGHITLFESNLPKIARTLQFLDDLGLDGLYTQITGEVGVPGTYEAVAPSALAVAQGLQDAIRERALRTPLTIADVPLCVAGELAPRLACSLVEPQPRAPAVVLPYSEWLSTFSSGQTRRFGAPCDGCGHRAMCYGVSKEVLRHFGDGWMRPRAVS